MVLIIRMAINVASTEDRAPTRSKSTRKVGPLSKFENGHGKRQRNGDHQNATKFAICCFHYSCISMLVKNDAAHCH